MMVGQQSIADQLLFSHLHEFWFLKVSPCHTQGDIYIMFGIELKSAIDAKERVFMGHQV